MAEGGVSGVIDIHIGSQNQEPNPHYQAHDELISGFPYRSYLVFRGKNNIAERMPGESLLTYLARLRSKQGHSFYHGNTNFMKDVLIWPKRTRVQNTGEEQWYKQNTSGDIVCEMANIRDLSKCTYISGKVSNPTWIHNNIIVEDSFWARHTAMAESSAGSLKLRFIISTSETIIYKNTLPILRTQGSLSISSNQNIQVSSTDIEGGEDQFWYGSYDFFLTIEPGEDQVVEISFNYDLTVTDEYPGVAELFTLIGAPSPISGWNCSGSTGQGYDINPIHKIREILTNPHPWGMGKDEIEINNENFMKAADRIYQERLGISWAIQDKDCLEAIEELCHHIEGGVRQNRQTGKYEIVLFRDNWFAESDIHTIAESKIKAIQLEVQNADEIINHLNVKFYDRDNMKDGAFSISENGLIKTVGHVISEDMDFPYFMNLRNAELVANWKLKQLSTPTWRGEFTTAWSDARKWNRYDLIKLPWSRKWSGTIMVRIMKISLGTSTNSEAVIDFMEVVPYSGMMNTSIVADQPTNISVLPPQPSDATVFELPYYLAVHTNGQRQVDDELNYDDSIGYVAALAAPVQNNSLNAAMYSDEAGASSDFDRVATIPYCEALALDQSINKQAHRFIVKESPYVSLHRARHFSNDQNGALIKINDEFMSFESYDDETKTLTVKRGVLDTGVFDHPKDSILYIFDMADLAINQTRFIDGEIIESKVITTTPSGIYPIDNALVHHVKIQSRAIRPYPPANVKINGEYWAEILDDNIEL